MFPRLWERRCPQRTVDGLCLKKWDVRLIFGIPSWLMPLRDHSGVRLALSFPWPGLGRKTENCLFSTFYFDIEKRDTQLMELG